jgi:hypothetical protein
MAKRKIKNQNYEDQIWKHNTINLNWRIKLKVTKTLTKWPRIKIRNPKNEDHIREYNIWWIVIE